MAGEKLRHHFGDYLVQAEVFVYSILAILLFLAALATILNSGKMLWEGLRHWTISVQTLQVLDQLLIVLMLIEILHTVRISIHSHTFITEPFSRRRPDRLHSANAGNHFGGLHSHQRGILVSRKSKPVPRQHD